jgi:hypothetical protein
MLKSTAVWCALAAIDGMTVAIVIGNFWLGGRLRTELGENA